MDGQRICGIHTFCFFTLGSPLIHKTCICSVYPPVTHQMCHSCLSHSGGPTCVSKLLDRNEIIVSLYLLLAFEGVYL